MLPDPDNFWVWLQSDVAVLNTNFQKDPRLLQEVGDLSLSLEMLYYKLPLGVSVALGLSVVPGCLVLETSFAGFF